MSRQGSVFLAALARLVGRGANCEHEHDASAGVQGGLAVAGLSALGIPEWALPALAQGETLVPFTDMPANVSRRRRRPAHARRPHDRRSVHAARPVLHDAALRPSRRSIRRRFGSRSSGLVDRPQSLSLDDLKKMGSTELVAGFECSGNRRPLQGLSSNGRWTGVPLRAVLDRAGVKAEGARVRVLRRRSRRRGSRVPHAEVQGRTAVRPQPVAREGAVARSRCSPTR